MKICHLLSLSKKRMMRNLIYYFYLLQILRRKTAFFGLLVSLEVACLFISVENFESIRFAPLIQGTAMVSPRGGFLFIRLSLGTEKTLMDVYKSKSAWLTASWVDKIYWIPPRWKTEFWGRWTDPRIACNYCFEPSLLSCHTFRTLDEFRRSTVVSDVWQKLGGLLSHRWTWSLKGKIETRVCTTV